MKPVMTIRAKHYICFRHQEKYQMNMEVPFSNRSQNN